MDMSVRDYFDLDNWYRWVQPIMGGTIPWAGGSGLYKEACWVWVWLSQRASQWAVFLHVSWLQVSALTFLGDGLWPRSVSWSKPVALLLPWVRVFHHSNRIELEQEPMTVSAGNDSVFTGGFPLSDKAWGKQNSASVRLHALWKSLSFVALWFVQSNWLFFF